MGSRNKKLGITYPAHSGKFNIDEKVMEIGCELFTTLALEYTKNPIY
jgi:metal-dependent amidase/aminoacylase/carboxypeptidase family protein